jgi:hypothetical protein
MKRRSKNGKGAVKNIFGKGSKCRHNQELGCLNVFNLPKSLRGTGAPGILPSLT